MSVLTRWREFQRSQREALRESNLLHPNGSEGSDGTGATRVLSGPDLLRDLLPDGVAGETSSAGPIPTEHDRHDRDAELAASGELPYGRAGRPLNRQSPFYLGFVGAIGVLTAILLWETIGRLTGVDPAVRAIVVSGYAQDDAIASYRDYGFVAAMNKPYTLQDLQATLETVITAQTCRIH